MTLPELTPAQGTKRGRVGFLQGCVQRVFFGNVNARDGRRAGRRGLRGVGAARARAAAARCSCTPGSTPASEARETIAAFEGCDTIVVNAAGCGSAMKDYGHLFRDDPEWSERAAAFSAKVRDVHELLAEHEPQAPRHPIDLVVAYHDACHLAHAQGVRAQPRALLQTIPGLELREPAEWELCCGSAGVWNLLNPEPAAELGQRKARNLLATGAQAVAAANPGCALQIGVHAGLPVHHPMELLAASIHGRKP